MLGKVINATFFAASLVAAGQAMAEDNIKITLPSDSLLYTPVYVARDLGYFHDQNISIETVPTNNGPRAIAAVVSGDAQMEMGVGSDPVIAHKAGADIIEFAALNTQYGPNIALTKQWAAAHHLSASSPYQEKLAGLKGITMGIAGAGGGSDQLVRYLAGQAGLDPDHDLTEVPLTDSSSMLAAFSQGRVNGLSVSAPVSNIAVRQFDGVMLLNTGIGQVAALQGFLGAQLSARGAWMKQNSALMVRFARALWMATDAMQDPARTDQARDALRKSTFAQIDPSLFADLWHDEILGAPKSPAITPQMLKIVIDFHNRFSEEKIADNAMDGAFTTEYVDKARPASK